MLPRRGPWPRRLYALLMPALYRREMRRCQALRVEQFPGVIPALVARALFGVPFVVTYGYHYAEVARIAGSRLKPRLYGLLESVVFPRAAGVIVTSPEMEARLAAHPRRPRLAYFPNGVDTARFAYAERSSRRFCAVRSGPLGNLDCLWSFMTAKPMKIFCGFFRRKRLSKWGESSIVFPEKRTLPNGASRLWVSMSLLPVR